MFAVTLQLLENYTQELFTQENKEVFVNIFTRLYSPNLLQTPQYKNI